MPLYEYQCKKCSHRFERIQKFSDPHVKKCPECGGAVEQVISAPAVQFKGSGWYVTDYGKGGSPSNTSKNGESSKSEDKSSSDKPKSESKSESKPESKTESKKKTEKK
jgi:putative FmdB family regulatory protein